MNHLRFANRWNADLIDEKYAVWRDDPDALDNAWRAFFEGFELANSGNGKDSAHRQPVSGSEKDSTKQSKFTWAIYAYRAMGHTQANINPLFKEVPHNPRLTLERLGFSEEDLDDVFWTGNFLDGTRMSLRSLLERLETIYCGSVGIEYLHIQETPQRRWL